MKLMANASTQIRFLDKQSISTVRETHYGSGGLTYEWQSRSRSTSTRLATVSCILYTRP